MEPRPVTSPPARPHTGHTLCRVEVMQSALTGSLPPDGRLETVLDRIEVTS